MDTLFVSAATAVQTRAAERNFLLVDMYTLGPDRTQWDYAHTAAGGGRFMLTHQKYSAAASGSLRLWITIRGDSADNIILSLISLSQVLIRAATDEIMLKK